MGLFLSNFHVYGKERSEVVTSLSAMLAKTAFSTIAPFSASGPSWAKRGALQYLISPRQGNWVNIIETHGWVKNAPRCYDVSLLPSGELKTYTLAFHLHDGDVLYYNLMNAGKDLDVYNSLPNYFEKTPLSEAAIREQRHQPECFSELLREGVTISELAAVLNRGWWKAHDQGLLDEHGVQKRNDDWISEDDRLVQIGNLLRLHGESDGFPYVAWVNSKQIPWAEFVGLDVSAAQG